MVIKTLLFGWSQVHAKKKESTFQLGDLIGHSTPFFEMLLKEMDSQSVLTYLDMPVILITLDNLK